MPEYLAPGVYVEEVPSGIKPIEGVSTSTAGFLGRTERGPDGAYLITSFAEYQRLYGGFLDKEGMYLPYALRGFFDNGGRRAFISRVPPQGAIEASLDQDGIFRIKARGRGRWGGRVYVKLHRATQQPANTNGGGQLYRLTIVYFRKRPESWVSPLATPDLLIKHGLSRVVPDYIEDFDNLRDAADIESTINGRSQLVRIVNRDVGKLLPKIPKHEPIDDEEEKKLLTKEWPHLRGSPADESAGTGITQVKDDLAKADTAVIAAEDPAGSETAKQRLKPAIEDTNKKATAAQQKAAALMVFVTGKGFDNNFQEKIAPVVSAVHEASGSAQEAANEANKFLKPNGQDATKVKSKADTSTTKGAEAETTAAAARTAAGTDLGKVQAANMAVEAAKLAVEAARAATELATVAQNYATAAKADADATKPLIDAIKQAATAAKRAILSTKKILRATSDAEAAAVADEADQAATEAKAKAAEAVTVAGADAAKKALADLATQSAAAAQQAITSAKAWRTLETEADKEDQSELENYREALRFLDLVDGVSIVVAPEHVNEELAGLRDPLISSCTQLADRVVLLSVSEKMQHEENPENIRHDSDSSFAAFYHPWIKVTDPLSTGPLSKPKSIPAIGHIAGILARTDITRGVHKAPANEVVLGALDLAVPVSKGQQDMLNPRSVNCIRDFRPDNRGIRLWGARTTSSDAEWKYLNVRRLFLFIEESIDQGTQWVVFEPNSDPTWAAVRRNVTNFLITVWRSGALMGNTPEEAFFVKCDRTTMTQDDIENGRLICVIGIAPVRPAEFVIFRISQKTAEAQT
jgi:phage tail sheath protein FI